MNVTIKVSREQEAHAKASESFLGPQAEGQPSTTAASSDPTLALLAAWDREDASDDPNELAARQRDGQEICAGMAAYPLSLRRSKS